MTKNIQKSIILLSAITIMCLPLLAQRTPAFKIHDRGILWETMKDDGTIGAPSPTSRYQFYPSMDWPGGPHDLGDKDDQRSYMVGAGVWVGWKDAGGTINFSENGPLTAVNFGTFEDLIKTENYVEDTGYDPSKPEQTIVAEWTTPENIHVKRTSKSWSFPDINNLIIVDYVVSNQTVSKIKDAYVGFVYLIRPSYQDVIVHNGWGDEATREDESVAYDSTRALLYAYDNYMANYTQYMWDWGNYWDDAEEIRTPGYAGYALLGADPASDGRARPANIFWASLIGQSQSFTLSGTASPADLYARLNGTDKSLQADSVTHITPIMIMSCGPYDIEASDSVRITIVEAVDGLPLKDCINIELGAELTAAQAKLPKGLALLQETIDDAQTLYNNDCRITNVPPPAPDIEIIPLPASKKISVSWEPYESDYLDPVTGRNDLKEYILYRSEYSFNGPWTTKVRSIKPKDSISIDRYYNEETGRWQYDDNTVTLGVGYYYAVTAKDSSGNESWITNRNSEPVRAASFPDSTTLHVKVFPNPFREKAGFPSKADANSIVWTNLPATCTIRIYTVAGELVRTLKHNNPNSGEEVWNQLTDARQRTAPGIYFWTVDSNVGTAKGSLVLIK
ncbi:MAG: hypothetical protein WC703_04900 [Candidatus Neomarinimicrobiota bacterium]